MLFVCILDREGVGGMIEAFNFLCFQDEIDR